MSASKRKHIAVEGSSQDQNGGEGTSKKFSSENGKDDDKGPENWEIIYKNIQTMRADRTAPVDSMGCERIHDKKAEPKVITIR